MGLPTFYDKLLQVPILNLSVRAIDRIAVRARALDPTAIVRALAPRRRHLAYVSIWTIVFVAISAAGGVGDDHPGQWLPFWKRACADGRPHACRYVADVQAAFCVQGSEWACNAATRPQETSPAARPVRCRRSPTTQSSFAAARARPRAHAGRTHGPRLPARLGPCVRGALTLPGAPGPMIRCGVSGHAGRVRPVPRASSPTLRARAQTLSPARRLRSESGACPKGRPSSRIALSKTRFRPGPRW